MCRVRGIEVETAPKLKRLTGKCHGHLAVPQQGRALTSLVGTVDRADIDGVKERIMTDCGKGVVVRPLAGQAFRKGHEVDDAELEIGLPGVFHFGP